MHVVRSVFPPIPAERRCRAGAAYHDASARDSQTLQLPRGLFGSHAGGTRQRDDRDRNRRVGPLVKADDAIEVVTDGLSADEVVARLEGLVRSRIS